MINDNLFKSFPKVTKSDWLKKVHEDLKGADFDDKLVWNANEDFPVQPYYTREDIDVLEIQDPGTTAQSERKWINYCEINVQSESQANSEACYALQFDGEGLIFNFGNTEVINFDALLANIDPTAIYLSFRTDQPIESIHFYFDYLQKKSIPLKNINGFCDNGLLENWSLLSPPLAIDQLKQLVQLTKHAPHFKGIHLKSHDSIDNGSNFTQELAFTSNKMVECIHQLTESEMILDDIIGDIDFELTITNDYFFDIAKIRAFKDLVSKILSLYSINNQETPILSSNSNQTFSGTDKEINLLRNTTGAMAAILGGCDALLITPHQNNSLFAQRIALNISNILREEAYFNKVLDPGKGSYYIESLTRHLEKEALKLFQSVEATGGFIAGLKSGLIPKSIEKISRKKGEKFKR